jgi:hypothetical protein
MREVVNPVGIFRVFVGKDEAVCPGVAEQLVDACAAIQPVVAGAPIDEVVARLTVEPVRQVVAYDPVRRRVAPAARRVVVQLELPDVARQL